MQSFNFNAEDIAEYFLAQPTSRKSEEITPLKLQKLLYYAQGFTLAILGKSLFTDRIEAWRHGPVCRNVYEKYKKYSYHPLPKFKDMDKLNKIKSSQNVAAILDAVWIYFKDYSGVQLEEMTHQEKPWQDAVTNGLNTEMPPYDLLKYFKGFVKKWKSIVLLKKYSVLFKEKR